MAENRQNCWVSMQVSSPMIIKKLRDQMHGAKKAVWEFSRQSSQSSSDIGAKFLDKIYDFVMRSEIVGNFETIEEFMKKINTNDLKLCDLIEYRCNINNVPYSHWALYIGDRQIIHFNQDNDGEVVKSQIDYKSENNLCRVNNLTRYAKSKGYSKNSYSDVMKAALKDLDICHIKYDLYNNNCGHMATLWKYGVGFNPEVNFLNRYFETQ
jgi:hypothetical protein